MDDAPREEAGQRRPRDGGNHLSVCAPKPHCQIGGARPISSENRSLSSSGSRAAPDRSGATRSMSQMWDRRRHSRWPGDRRPRRSSAGDPWPRAPAPQTAFCDRSLPAFPVPPVRYGHDGRALGGRGLASVRASGPLLGTRALRPRRAAGSRGPSARLPGPARRRGVAVASARSLDRSACGRTRRPARPSPRFRAARGGNGWCRKGHRFGVRVGRGADGDGAPNAAKHQPTQRGRCLRRSGG